ncbi:MAG: polysaccharide deacetylase family protein, partial [Pseudomonadota bacterium]
MTRDLIGYGGRWPDFTWPNGSRLAVSVVINFEEGAELQVIDGDPVSERIGEVISVVPEGRADPGQAQIFAYGTRAGAWRMADATRRYGIPTTLFACGRAAERAGPVLTMLAQGGHETACHGWLWRPHADYDSAHDEAFDLDRAAAAIRAATGEDPRGFFCRGAESPFTRKLLAERNYLYTSNGFDDDLPYSDPSGLIVVPYGLDANDMKFFHPNGFVRATEMLEYVADALDVLEAEAEQGLPRLLNIGFHLRIVGRPGRFKAFEGVLQE